MPAAWVVRCCKHVRTRHVYAQWYTWGGGRPTLKKCAFFGLKSCSMSDQAQNTRCGSANTSARCLKSTSTILRRWASSSWSNSTLEQARDLILMATPRFLGMANHLGPFPEASDGPEGQEQPVWAVGGQGALHGVTQLLSKLEL